MDGDESRSLAGESRQALPSHSREIRTHLLDRGEKAIVSLPDLSSLDLACPPLPLPNVLRPVEVGSNPSSGGRYTPFFIKPLVWHENGDEHVKGGIAGTDRSRDDVVDGDRGLGKGLKRLRLDNLSQIGVSAWFETLPLPRLSSSL